MLFSLGALCECGQAERMAAWAFRETAAHFGIPSASPTLFRLFCSRFSQVVRWHQGQRFYLQRDMLRDARRAGLRALGVSTTPAQDEVLDRIWESALAGRVVLRRAHAMSSARSRPGASALLL